MITMHWTWILIVFYCGAIAGFIFLAMFGPKEGKNNG
jgi:hypothetical protein